MRALLRRRLPLRHIRLLSTKPPKVTPVALKPPGERETSVRATKMKLKLERISLGDLPTSLPEVRKKLEMLTLGGLPASLPDLQKRSLAPSVIRKVNTGQAAPTPPTEEQLEEAKEERTERRRKVKELPQGLLGGVALPPLADESVAALPFYPPVLQQVTENMARLGAGTVLLTRVGGFYELYFGHAERWAEPLGLRVTYRKTALGPVAMSGFPHYQLDRFLKMLVVGESMHVAVVEEFQSDAIRDGRDPQLVRAEGGAVWERRITRIVTPGTLVDEEWVEQGEGNFLLAVELGAADTDDIGLAWADLGTGEVWCHKVSHDALARAGLANCLAVPGLASDCGSGCGQWLCVVARMVWRRGRDVGRLAAP